MFDKLKQYARHYKSETLALYFAARHPETPWYAKLLVAGIVAYAISPIDLIPDFIPVLGYLDDIFLIPIGIALAIKLIPSNVLNECRLQAKAVLAKDKPVSRIAGAIIIFIWSILIILCLMWIYNSIVN